MNALSLYVTTTRMVFQPTLEPDDSAAWSDINRLLAFLRQSLTCAVCGSLLQIPMSSTVSTCQHHVCKSCIGGKMRLKPSCSVCKDHSKFLENTQLRILLQSYQELCDYISVSGALEKWGSLSTSSNLTNGSSSNVSNNVSSNGSFCGPASFLELVEEGIKFEDNYSFSEPPALPSLVSASSVKKSPNVKNKSPVKNNNVKVTNQDVKMTQQLTNGLTMTSNPVSMTSGPNITIGVNVTSGVNMTSGVNVTSGPTVTSKAVSVTQNVVNEVKMTTNDVQMTNVTSNDVQVAALGQSSGITSVQMKNLTSDFPRTARMGGSRPAPKVSMPPSSNLEPEVKKVKVSNPETEVVTPAKVQEQKFMNPGVQMPSPEIEVRTQVLEPQVLSTSISSVPEMTISRTIVSKQPLGLTPKVLEPQILSTSISSVIPTTPISGPSLMKIVPSSAAPQPLATMSPMQPPNSPGKNKSCSKRRGCRCGLATPTPGKLTCCGQRCPCYVDGKGCYDCKCRGCRNPHRANTTPGITVIPAVKPALVTNQVVKDDNVTKSQVGDTNTSSQNEIQAPQMTVSSSASSFVTSSFPSPSFSSSQSSSFSSSQSSSFSSQTSSYSSASSVPISIRPITTIGSCQLVPIPSCGSSPLAGFSNLKPSDNLLLSSIMSNPSLTLTSTSPLTLFPSSNTFKNVSIQPQVTQMATNLGQTSQQMNTHQQQQQHFNLKPASSPSLPFNEPLTLPLTLDDLNLGSNDPTKMSNSFIIDDTSLI